MYLDKEISNPHTNNSINNHLLIQILELDTNSERRTSVAIMQQLLWPENYR